MRIKNWRDPFPEIRGKTIVNDLFGYSHSINNYYILVDANIQHSMVFLFVGYLSLRIK